MQEAPRRGLFFPYCHVTTRTPRVLPWVVEIEDSREQASAARDAMTREKREQNARDLLKQFEIHEVDVWIQPWAPEPGFQFATQFFADGSSETPSTPVVRLPSKLPPSGSRRMKKVTRQRHSESARAHEEGDFVILSGISCLAHECLPEFARTKIPLWRRREELSVLRREGEKPYLVELGFVRGAWRDLNWEHMIHMVVFEQEDELGEIREEGYSS